MPLVQATLEKDLKKVFSDMKDAGENASNDEFSKGISEAIKKFAESGTVTTVDTGATAAGTYAGSGSGTLSLDASLCKNVIDTTTALMKTKEDDAKLATAIANGIQAMTSAGTIDITSNGVLTPPPPATPVPIAGSGKATIVCIPAPIVLALNAAFASMKNMTEGGDDYLATQLATAVNAYYNANTVTGAGTGNLLGVVMSGKLS